MLIGLNKTIAGIIFWFNTVKNLESKSLKGCNLKKEEDCFANIFANIY